MEQIGNDEHQEHIKPSDESNQILIQNIDLTEQLGLPDESTKETFEQELQETQQDYDQRIKRNQEPKAKQALEKIKLLKRGIELIILTNLRGIKQEDPKIKQLSKQMEEKIQELGFNNYEDIIQEIIDLQEKLQWPITNKVKKKQFEQELSGCLEVLVLHEGIQKILCKNKQPNLNNEQLEKEYTQLLEELGTTLKDVQKEIQECKNEIQKYIGKNEKKEKMAKENLVKYERLNELAEILQKNEKDSIPNQKNVQVYDLVENNLDQEETKSMYEQKEDALKEYKQQKLIEAIKANYDRTKNNVQSFEKSLNECLYHLWNKITPIKNAKEISNEELLRLIEDLQLRDQIEELGLYQELNVAISYIKTTQNYDKVFDTLKVLAFNSSLIAFNFLELIHLMDLVEHSSNIIKNKDIILFLGVTGSGKSTTIQYLCGSTMKAMKVKGLNHIEAIEVKNNQLKNIKSSPFAKSETRYVTPITMNLLDLRYPLDQEVIFVDSPGSGDLESVEVDLANTLGIFKSVTQAKSVRLVLLFGYQNLGNRFEHLKEQLRFYSSIIDDLQDNCKAITYAFTQVPHDQTDQIEKKINDIYNNLNREDQNNDLETFLNDAIYKSYQKEIIIINPLDKDPNSVLKKILKSKPIKYPRDAFKFTMSSKAKNSLQKEFNLSLKKIEKSITKTNEYSLAIEKLRILKSVTTILEDDRDTKKLYNDVITRIKRIYQNYGDKVKEFIKRHQVVENVIQQTEIKEVKDILKKLNEMKEIRKEFFDDEDMKGSEDYEQEIRTLALKISSNLNKIEIDDRKWDISLAKIEVFSKEFELCSEIEKQTLDYYQEKNQQHLESFNYSVISDIQSLDFEKQSKENSSQFQSSKLFQRLNKAKETLKYQKYQELLNQTVKSSEIQIKQQFETIYNQNIAQYINQEDNNSNFNYDGTQQINNFLQLLNIFQFNYSYLSENLKSFFEQQKIDLKNNMLQIFNRSYLDFKDSLQNENDAKLKQTFHNINCIKNIKALSIDIYSKFYQISFDIEQQMKHNMEKVETVLHQLINLDNSYEIENKLKKLKSSLRKAIHISKILDSEELLEQFKEDVQLELDEWKEGLMRNKIPPKVSGIFQYNKLDDIFKVNSLLKAIENCCSILKQREDFNQPNYIEDQLDESFSRIEISITYIDSSYAESIIKKSDFDLLYKHFLSIKIAENHRFYDFQNKHSKSTSMLSSLEDKILEIVNKQAKLISSAFIKCFEQLNILLPDVARDQNEKQLQQQWKQYDNIIEMLIYKINLINDAKIYKNEFFEIMIDVDHLINESWRKELLTYREQIKSNLEDLKQTPNKKIQQIYLAFAYSLSNFDQFMPQEQMKNVYEDYKIIFSKNQRQSEFYNKIQKELDKDTCNYKHINEYLEKIQKVEFDESSILTDIEDLLEQHVNKLRAKLYYNQEGDLFDFQNTEVIQQLMKMHEKIDPNGTLIESFRGLITRIIKEFEIKVKVFLKENMDQMKQDIYTHQFMKADSLLETYKTQLKALQILNYDAYSKYQKEFDDYYKNILKEIPQSRDKLGLNDIKQNSQLFKSDELKNKELQNLYTQIKTKVNNQIKQKD